MLPACHSIMFSCSVCYSLVIPHIIAITTSHEVQGPCMKSAFSRNKHMTEIKWANASMPQTQNTELYCTKPRMS